MSPAQACILPSFALLVACDSPRVTHCYDVAGSECPDTLSDTSQSTEPADVSDADTIPSRELIEPPPCDGCPPNSGCDRLYGEDPRTSPNSVIVLGTLLPRSGPLSSFGESMDNGVNLAIEEINQSGGVLGKKLAVVSCDDGTDADQAVRAARHLADVAGVKAIIGAGASSVTIEAFTTVAKGSGILMLSPSATSPALSNLADEGLLWRTVPSDAIQGQAIAEYVLHMGYNDIAVVNRNDAYGNGLAAAIQTRLCTSGRFECTSDTFLSRLYSAQNGSAQQQDEQVSAVTFLAERAPDVVVLIGYVPDGISFLNFARDKGLTFILTDGMRDPDLLGTDPAQVGVQDQKILCSLVGTNPAAPSGGLFEQFALKYEQNFQAPPGPFATNAYDAAYLIALAFGAARGKGEFEPDGRALAEGLTRLSSGNRIELGVQDLVQALTQLSASEDSSIDVVGVSGPLDFDPARGEAASAIEMWRFDLSLFGIANLGVVYDGQSNFSFDDIVGAGPCAGDR